jgi:hypothetical protein
MGVLHPPAKKNAWRCAYRCFDPGRGCLGLQLGTLELSASNLVGPD